MDDVWCLCYLWLNFALRLLYYISGKVQVWCPGLWLRNGCKMERRQRAACLISARAAFN